MLRYVYDTLGRYRLESAWHGVKIPISQQFVLPTSLLCLSLWWHFLLGFRLQYPYNLQGNLHQVAKSDDMVLLIEEKS